MYIQTEQYVEEPAVLPDKLVVLVIHFGLFLFLIWLISFCWSYLTVLLCHSFDSDLESLRSALMKTTLESRAKPPPKAPGNVFFLPGIHV